MQSRVNRGDEALNGRLSRRQFGRIVVLSVAGVGVLAACAAPAPTPTSPPKPIATTAPAAVPPTAVPARATTAPVAGGTLTVAVRNPICGLDPGKTCGYPSGPAALYLISNRLVRVDSALQLLPDLAESWEVSADKLKWTFRLRKGVKFHDGTPFNSQAVKAHFDHSRDPELAATGSVKFPQVVSIDTPDEHTVVFGTETPFGPFLSYLAVFIRVLMSPAAIQKHGAKALGQNPVGTGPYKVTEFQPNVRLALERNDEYFGGRPPLDKVVIIPAPEASARTNLVTLHVG